MATRKEDEKKLSEVRVILQSLQKIGSDDSLATGGADKPGYGLNSLESLTNRREFSQTRGRPAGLVPVDNGPDSRNFGKWRGILVPGAVAAGAVVLLAAAVLFNYRATPPASKPAPESLTASAAAPAVVPMPAVLPLPAEAPRAIARAPAAVAAVPPAPPVAPAPPSEPPSPAIANAKQMMDAGKIIAARQLLLQQSLSGSQDGAWLLARSYDPNYLASVRSPDAAADKEKAAEWYNRWREIGARKGVVMDDVHFRRLIETMK